jgi:hypothetical protein
LFRFSLRYDPAKLEFDRIVAPPLGGALVNTLRTNEGVVGCVLMLAEVSLSLEPPDDVCFAVFRRIGSDAPLPKIVDSPEETHACDTNAELLRTVVDAAVPKRLPPQPRLTAIWYRDTNLSIASQAEPGVTTRVEKSLNLKTWEPLSESVLVSVKEAAGSYFRAALVNTNVPGQ